jgi:hypothetical protein
MTIWLRRENARRDKVKCGRPQKGVVLNVSEECDLAKGESGSNFAVGGTGCSRTTIAGFRYVPLVCYRAVKRAVKGVRLRAVLHKPILRYRKRVATGPLRKRRLKGLWKHYYWRNARHGKGSAQTLPSSLKQRRHWAAALAWPTEWREMERDEMARMGLARWGAAAEGFQISLCSLASV